MFLKNKKKVYGIFGTFIILYSFKEKLATTRFLGYNLLDFLIDDNPFFKYYYIYMFFKVN